MVGHLHDGVISLLRPECLVKMLSYSNLSSLLEVKRQLEKLATQQRPCKITWSCKWPILVLSSKFSGFGLESEFYFQFASVCAA